MEESLRAILEEEKQWLQQQITDQNQRIAVQQQQVIEQQQKKMEDQQQHLDQQHQQLLNQLLNRLGEGEEQPVRVFGAVHKGTTENRFNGGNQI